MIRIKKGKSYSEIAPALIVADSKYYRVEQIMDIFEVTRRTVYNWFKYNHMTRVRFGKRLYVAEQELVKYIEKGR